MSPLDVSHDNDFSSFLSSIFDREKPGDKAVNVLGASSVLKRTKKITVLRDIRLNLAGYDTCD